MPGNGEPLKAGTIAGIKEIFCVVNKTNFFSENVKL